MATESPLNHVSGVVGRISRVVNSIGAVILVCMMLLVVTDVSLRFFFNRPVEGSFELVEFMMAVLVCLGMAFCGYKKGHTAVEFIMSRFSERTQAVVDSLNYLVSAILFGLIAWKSGEQAGVLKESETITTVLELPLYPFLWVLAVGSGLLSLVFFLQFVESIKGAVKK